MAADTLQDICLLVPIFSPCSLLPYTRAGPASFLSSLPSSFPSAFIFLSIVFLLVGRAPASSSGCTARLVAFEVGCTCFLPIWG